MGYCHQSALVQSTQLVCVMNAQTHRTVQSGLWSVPLRTEYDFTNVLVREALVIFVLA